MNQNATVHSLVESAVGEAGGRMRTEPDGGVEVRIEPDGSIVIGPPPAGAAGLVFIALTGSMLAVDPMSPHGPGQLRIGDPSQLSAVEALYGTEVAAAVVAADDVPIRLPLVESPEREALVRLGVLRWLADRCPVALDRPLLILEENVLALRLSGLLDGERNRTDALLEWAPTILEWARLARRTGSEFQQTAAVPALVVAALREIEAHLPVGDERLEDTRHEAELLEAQAVLGLPAVDVDDAWVVIGELGPQSALVMGKDDALTHRGWGPVDWDRTPPSATSRTEDAVSWRVVPQGGGDLLTVVVKAFPPSPHAELLVVPDGLGVPPTELQATLHLSSWPLPLAVVELLMRPENGALMGSLRLDPVVGEKIRNSEGSALSVEVQVRGVPGPPRVGSDARRAAAVRWATRGLCSLRLASVAPPGVRDELTTTGTEALASAARRYNELPDDDGAAAAAQCTALIPAAQEDRQYWTPEDVEVEPGPAGRDPVEGIARATTAEIWYAAAAPLVPRAEGR